MYLEEKVLIMQCKYKWSFIVFNT